MAGLDALRVQIAAAKRELQDERALESQLHRNIDQANERQRLRRDLENIQRQIQCQRSCNRWSREQEADIDKDLDGDHMPTDQRKHLVNSNRTQGGTNVAGSIVNCSNAVIKGEYIWKIEGVSWLKNTLNQMDETYAESDRFFIGPHCFFFVYHPKRGVIADRDGQEQRGSLAIIHDSNGGITFRYKMSIKNSCGDFVQWGEMGNASYPDPDTEGWAFGPDVQFAPATPEGVFGLGHADLLKSGFVVGDALTTRFEMEVRPYTGCDHDHLRVKPRVEVPLSTIGTNMLAWLEDAKCADISFMVEGQTIKAHSQILAARSEVFDRQLNGSLLESVSKEVLVEDCDVATFKALLKFVYTDDFSFIEEFMRVACAGAPGVRTSLLQSLLAVSHKYQLVRLRLWCEQQLCECLDISDVCSLVCHAHLYEAKQLEEVCLLFIKEHVDQVMATSSFGSLAKDWPEVMLKISVFNVGVTPSTACAAMEVVRSSKKRKCETSE